MCMFVWVYACCFDLTRNMLNNEHEVWPTFLLLLLFLSLFIILGYWVLPYYVFLGNVTFFLKAFAEDFQQSNQ